MNPQEKSTASATVSSAPAIQGRWLLASVWILLGGWFANGAVADEAGFSVASYNIRYANPSDGPDFWPHRVDAVAKFLADHDVLGLQEATFPQIDDLRSRLTEFAWYGLGREDGKQQGEAAPIFYRSTRFDVTQQGTIWLSENPQRIGVAGWDAALPRTMTWMILRDKQSDQEVFVANTHFDHRGEVARAKSAELIRRFIQQHHQGLPVIVMGDFNCTPQSDPYVKLTLPGDADSQPLLDARLESVTPPKGGNSTWCGFREIVPDRVIDYIFLRGPVTVLEFETHDPKTESGRFASDHLPVQALVRIAGDESAP
jgi:endonuclease/exonuclease/phosphatase family metal-dependent hydrolase